MIDIGRTWRTLSQTTKGKTLKAISALDYHGTPSTIRCYLEVTEIAKDRHHIDKYYYVDGDPEHIKYGNVIFAEARVVELAFTDTVPTSAAFE